MTTPGESADIKTGFPFQSADFSASGVRLCRGDNIGQGRLRWENAAHWNAETPGEYTLSDGDIVLAMDRPWIGAGLKLARVHQTDLPALLVQRVARFRAKPGVDQRFLEMALKSPSFSEYLQGVQTGTAVPHISSSQIKGFQFRLPALGEQQAVAAVLGALEDKIAGNVALASMTANLAIAHVATAPATCVLKQIANLDRATISPLKLDATSIPHYSLPAYDNGMLPSVEAPSDVKSSKFWMDSPRVLVSKLNPRIPRVWPVDETTGLPGLASTEFMPLMSAVVSYQLLWAVTSEPEFGRRLEAQVAGTSGSHQRVKPDDLMSTPVLDPRSLPESVKDLINSLVTLTIQTRAENRTLAELRDTLLPALMSGRLWVKDAERQLEDVV